MFELDMFALRDIWCSLTSPSCPRYPNVSYCYILYNLLWVIRILFITLSSSNVSLSIECLFLHVVDSINHLHGSVFFLNSWLIHVIDDIQNKNSKLIFTFTLNIFFLFCVSFQFLIEKNMFRTFIFEHNKFVIFTLFCHFLTTLHYDTIVISKYPRWHSKQYATVGKFCKTMMPIVSYCKLHIVFYSLEKYHIPDIKRTMFRLLLYNLFSVVIPAFLIIQTF